MQTKYINLIKKLIEQQPQTAISLADKMNCSSRTIKNYIHDINIEYPDLIMSTNKGYVIDSENVNKLSFITESFPNSSQERVTYIINKLVHNDKGCDLFDLCETLFVSYSTIKGDLTKIKRKLEKFETSSSKQSNFLCRFGKE